MVTASASPVANPYLLRTFVENGRDIDQVLVPGSPPPAILVQSVEIPPPQTALGINTLDNVPAFSWCYGCAPTAAAMIMGYFDIRGCTNMYAGPANGSVCPLNNNAYWGNGESPLSATHIGKDGRTTRGHVEDYWIATGNTGADPYIAHGWTERTPGDCTADFMGTSQSKFGNADGATMIYYYTNGARLYDYTYCEPGDRDGCHGMRLFAESRGYAVAHNYSQYIYGYNGNTMGFTFGDFMSEIDEGNLVMIQLEGHTMVGFGYNETGNIIYIHDTWDNNSHSMTWGGSYGGHRQCGVTVLRLETIQTELTFDPRGGSVSPSWKIFNVGWTYGTLPTPTRAGYIFDGWWTGLRGSGEKITGSSIVEESCTTLYAKWTDAAAADYDYTVNNGWVAITGYKGSGSAVSIPETLDDYPVASIGAVSLAYNTSLTSLTIPSGVTNIGIFPIVCCYNLTSITVVASNPFYSSLGGVLFTKNKSTLIQYPVGKKGSYTIPDNVTFIRETAFNSSTGLVNVSIGGGVTNIGHDAFCGCSGLINVSIPTNVIGIGNSAFASCTSVTNITIQFGIDNIGYSVFAFCRSLTRITIPDSVTAIGEMAFFDCHSLTSITIPASVTSIGSFAFNGCAVLTRVTIPGGVTNIGNSAFGYCTGLTGLELPSGITTIGDDAFYNCTRLTSITIPDGVTSIGAQAFNYCILLNYVTIPSGVTNIGYGAFSNCFRMTNVLFKGNAPFVSSGLHYKTIVYYLPGTTGWGTEIDGRPTLLWNPQIQHNAAFGVTGKLFGFNITGTTNIPVVVEATTNLSSNVWVPLTNTTLGVTGSLYFSDQSWTNHPARFYRIVWP